MPLYEYECENCGYKFEMRRSFSEGASAVCPECESRAQRVFAPVPIVFKGSGFYVTDYRKDNGKQDTASAAKGEKSTCCSSSGCSD
jgi:putative FmdB family regulatory protein